VLHRLIRAALPAAADVLDCACGIGTQAIGLARLGYRVRGTDVSPGAVERARAEAARARVELAVQQADFRDLSAVPGVYDAVLCCDNALPHLLSPPEVVAALRAMRGKLRPAGLLVVTLRDFDAALAARPPLAPPLVLDGPPRRVVVRLHDWHATEPWYDVRYLLLTEATGGWTVVERRSRYRALTRHELEHAAAEAGFVDVAWPDDRVVGDQLVFTARAGR
jgi:SAM-dependent methyltransferase